MASEQPDHQVLIRPRYKVLGDLRHGVSSTTKVIYQKRVLAGLPRSLTPSSRRRRLEDQIVAGFDCQRAKSALGLQQPQSRALHYRPAGNAAVCGEMRLPILNAEFLRQRKCLRRVERHAALDALQVAPIQSMLEEPGDLRGQCRADHECEQQCLRNLFRKSYDPRDCPIHRLG